MSITLKQFNGAIVTPTDDAVLYAHLLSTSGVLSGCAVTATGGDTLNVADGRGFICGRQFVIEAQKISASLPTSGTANGRLLIQIDMADTENPITFVTQAAAVLPELQQDDINGSGTIYQFPLATYSASATQVSALINVAAQLPETMISFNGRSGAVEPQSGDYTGALVKMDGYSKPASGGAVEAGDTVNQAVGKIEKRIDTATGTASVTIAASDWKNGTDDYYYTATVSGVTASNKVIAAPAATASDVKFWSKCSIYAATQDANTMTFRAKKKPKVNIGVNVLIIN